MNVFHKVTLQSLRKNRTRTIVTIIGIILSAAMVCAVTTFAGSLHHFMLESAIYEEGNWHGRANGVPYESASQSLRNDRVEAFEAVRQLGYAPLPDSENAYKPYLYVLGMEPNASMLPIHLISGRMPETPDEILLPEHLAENGGVRHRLGDVLTLTLGYRELEGERLGQINPAYTYDDKGREIPNGESFVSGESRSYTVVGFYSRFSYRIEDYSAPGYTALTISQPEAEGIYDFYFRMKDPAQTFRFMEEAELYGDPNDTVLMYQGSFKYDSFSQMLGSMAAIVIALIMFGSVALIYNAFSISMSERTKQFGLLSSVGATRRQLGGMIRYEALVVSLIGIPIGVLCGVGGIGLTLYFLGDRFRSMGLPIPLRLHVNPWAVLAAAVIAFATVFISAWIPSRRARRVTAVEAIRQNTDIRTERRKLKTGKLTGKLFGLPGTLAVKYYKRSRKKYRATVVSLFMSVVLFVSAFSFTGYMTESVEEGYATRSADLTYYMDGEQAAKADPMTLLSLIKEDKTVTEAALLRGGGYVMEIAPEELTKEYLAATNLAPGEAFPDYLSSHITLLFVDDVQFAALLKDNHLDKALFTDPEHPRGVAVDAGRVFNYETQRYEKLRILCNEMPRFQLTDFKLLEGYHLWEVSTNEAGEDIVRYMPEDSKLLADAIEVPIREAMVVTPVEAGAVIHKAPFFTSDEGITLIYPLGAANMLLPGEHASGIENGWSFAVSSSGHKLTEKNLKNLLIGQGLSTKNLTNYAEMVESQKNTVLIVRVFSYGFIALISLIAAANVFNTISTNMGLRRRDFAMLRSVGMTRKGFRKMMRFECLLYGSKALLLGLPVSAMVTLFIWKAVNSGFQTDFRLPWAAMAIAALGVFLVVFASMLYAGNKVRKENLLEALRNENL